MIYGSCPEYVHTAPHPPQTIVSHHLSYNVKHNLERVPRAILQPLMPQTLRKDSSTALPRAEPCERTTPNTNRSRGVSGLGSVAVVMVSRRVCVRIGACIACLRNLEWRSG
jgi:hypothetical protein